jgi:hypothetical protein
MVAVIFLFALIASNSFAGDKEDVKALVEKSAEYFNKQDYTSYWSLFTDDNT